MSRALISSRAATARAFNSSTCIEFLVEMVAANIIENGVWKQIARAATRAQRRTNRGCRDVERRNVHRQHRAGWPQSQLCGIAQQARRGLARQCGRQLAGVQLETGTMRDHQVGELEQLLPA